MKNREQEHHDLANNGQEADAEAPLDEFKLIHHLSHNFHSYRHHVLVPNGDDAAIFKPQQGQGQIICVDTMVEEIHFKRITMSPYHIGYKALAVNLSDIAAMGGDPHSFLVSLAIPPSWKTTDLKEIYRGMKALADEYKVDLLGGDTVSTEEKLVITVTAIGQVDENVRLLRSNAQPGDLLFVTGALGSSAAGLELLLQKNEIIYSDTTAAGQTGEQAYSTLLQAHQLPRPHIRQGQLLAQWVQQAVQQVVNNRKQDMQDLSAEHLVSKKQRSISLNDVSDGLASEAFEIASSSGVNIVIHKQDIPIDTELQDWAYNQQKDVYQYALHGGEDFVLVGTIPMEWEKQIRSTFTQEKLPFYIIGNVTSGSGEVWLEEQGQTQKLHQRGYNHFNKNREKQMKDD